MTGDDDDDEEDDEDDTLIPSCQFVCRVGGVGREPASQAVGQSVASVPGSLTQFSDRSQSEHVKSTLTASSVLPHFCGKQWSGSVVS